MQVVRIEKKTTRRQLVAGFRVSVQKQRTCEMLVGAQFTTPPWPPWAFPAKVQMPNYVGIFFVAIILIKIPHPSYTNNTQQLLAGVLVLSAGWCAERKYPHKPARVHKKEIHSEAPMWQGQY